MPGQNAFVEGMPAAAEKRLRAQRQVLPVIWPRRGLRSFFKASRERRNSAQAALQMCCLTHEPVQGVLLDPRWVSAFNFCSFHPLALTLACGQLFHPGACISALKVMRSMVLRARFKGDAHDHYNNEPGSEYAGGARAVRPARCARVPSTLSLGSVSTPRRW